MMMKVDNGEKTHNIQCFDSDDMAFEGVTIDVRPTLEKNDQKRRHEMFQFNFQKLIE